jgi:hypothetical protein
MKKNTKSNLLFAKDLILIFIVACSVIYAFSANRTYVECFPQKVEIVKQWDYIDRPVICQNAECTSLEIIGTGI